MTMDDLQQQLADDAQTEKYGRELITNSWQSLGKQTTDWLTETGRYDLRGQPLNLENDHPRDDIRRLEYWLGSLEEAAISKLPGWGEQADLPQCALDARDYVGLVLGHQYGRELPFLRMAAHALRQRELAHLLINAPAATKPLLPAWLKATGLLTFGGFCILLMLVAPIVIAAALVSAAQGSQGDTAAALYGVGFIAWMLWIANGVGKKKTPADLELQTYLAWQGLNFQAHGDWLTTGAGLQAFFENMQKNGLPVPLIAFDLCYAMKTAYRG